jgi:hypothetical protein
MVGAVVAVAIVIVFFFMAGVGFGVFWIFAKSVRIDRKQGSRVERTCEPDEDPGEPDSDQEDWPLRH